MIYGKILKELGEEHQGVPLHNARSYLMGLPIIVLVPALRRAVDANPRLFAAYYRAAARLKPNRQILSSRGERMPNCVIAALGGTYAQASLKGEDPVKAIEDRF